MTEQNSQTQSDQRDNEITEAGSDSRIEEFLYVTTGEAESESVEVNNVVGQVNCDRGHTDPHERLAPFLAFPDINHEIEKPEQQCAVAASQQNVGGGPDFLDDRKLKSPKMSQHHTRQPGE